MFLANTLLLRAEGLAYRCLYKLGLLLRYEFGYAFVDVEILCYVKEKELGAVCPGDMATTGALDSIVAGTIS